MKPEEKNPERECKREGCRKKFKPPKDNPGQEYCSGTCWQEAHKK